MGGTLFKHLRSGRRKRRKRYGSKSSRGIIPNRRPINSRPKAVEDRKQFGHWEGDTMIGKNHKQGVVIWPRGCYACMRRTSQT